MFIKSFIGTVFAFALPMLVMADEVGQPAGIKEHKSFNFHDPQSGQLRELTFADVRNPAVMREFLPKVEGVTTVFDAYIAVGYSAFHSYTLTNAEVLSVIREIIPSTPFNQAVDSHVKAIRNLYQPIGN